MSQTESEKVWRVEPHSEYWYKEWVKYDSQGKPTGCMILVENGSPELIQAIKEAFDRTEVPSKK